MKNIFVGNLSYSATEEDVRQAFAAYGAVDRVNILTDRETGRSRGFGFVEMPNDQEADRAINAINGATIAGRTVHVNEARPREERPRSFGRGTSGGGGGYRGGAGGGSGW